MPHLPGDRGSRRPGRRPAALPTTRPSTDASPVPAATGRPLIVTALPQLLDDLLRLAATAGVDVDAAADAAGARRSWSTAPLVLVGPDAAAGCIRGQLPRRPHVTLVADDLDDASSWRRAVELGAEHVVFLPDAEDWVVDALAGAVSGDVPDGPLIAVIGGRGGAGATTLSCALAITAVRSGASCLLVDADMLGGGIDLVFGAEDRPGLRWPDLSGTSGRLPATALAEALPQLHQISVLSWDRETASAIPAEAMESVLSAGRRSHQLVVVDVPRGVDDAAMAVLRAATLVLLVVPAEVRAAAAASRVAAVVAAGAHDLRLVVRGPAPAGLGGEEIARALAIPLAGELRAEPGLALGLECGEVPAGSGRGPLAAFCHQLLSEVTAQAGRAA